MKRNEWVGKICSLCWMHDNGNTLKWTLMFYQLSKLSNIKHLEGKSPRGTGVFGSKLLSL